MHAKRFVGLALGAATAALVLLLLAAFVFPAPALAQGSDPDDPITVVPYPPRPHEPTEIRVSLSNTDTFDLVRYAQFYWSEFGIGMELHPIGARRPFTIPASSEADTYVTWFPPRLDAYCFYVFIFSEPGAPEPIHVFQRNVHIRPYLPVGRPASAPLHVRNPLTSTAIVALNLIGPDVGWAMQLEPANFGRLAPGEVVTAMLTVTYTGGAPLPPEGVRFQVKGLANDQAIGQVDWRLMPPLLLHTQREPFYAESEITVHPYPLTQRHPAEVGVAVYNPTDDRQSARLILEVAPLGIGLPFEPISEASIAVPPHQIYRHVVKWSPWLDGLVCVRARLVFDHWPELVLVSQRNVDILHFPLPDELSFPVDNTAGNLTMTLRLVRRAAGLDWPATLLPERVLPGQRVTATLTLSQPQFGLRHLLDDAPIVDVEGVYNAGQPDEVVVGGIRKLFRRPVPLHIPGEPPYAESDISVHPYPPRAGEPTRICTVASNQSRVTQTVGVYFQVANFGAGVPFAPLGYQSVQIPPHGQVRVCETWIPPKMGHFCVQVLLRSDLYGDVWSQRNLDVAEHLRPLTPDKSEFVIGNPTQEPATITLGLVGHLDGWEISLDQYEWPNVKPGEVLTASLTVTPPAKLPELADQPVVDIEAFINHERIGGFRKTFRPPIPLHRPEDPVFAESEISITPYPPIGDEPVEICSELRNQTLRPQAAVVEFQAAAFGIGQPFQSIGRLPAVLPALDSRRVCMHWVPIYRPDFSVRVVVHISGFPAVSSQRSLDAAEVLLPGQPSDFTFPVYNPHSWPLTITLGLHQHLDWDMALSVYELPNVAPGDFRLVTLWVTPTREVVGLEDESPVVDVLALAEGELIGGFRKVFRQPVWLHRPDEPVYAESEISIAPYPARAGEPSDVCVDLRNPTMRPHTVTLRLAWSEFGIGQPFQRMVAIPDLVIPARRVRTVCRSWTPPHGGQFGIEATLLAAGYERIVRSARMVDVQEVLYPGARDHLRFPVTVPANPELGLQAGALVTVQLGLIPHISPDWGWKLGLSTRVLSNVVVGRETRWVTLTVAIPAQSPMPPDGQPIVDVEAHVGGWLIGGLRKVYRPPVPIHDPRDPIYAEREISVNPYPPRANEPALVCSEVRNPTRSPQRLLVTFRAAPFGIGLPFRPIAPPVGVKLDAYKLDRVCVRWVPPYSGQFGVETELAFLDWPQLPPVVSQRVMDVSEVLIAGQLSTFEFVVANPTSQTITLTLGLQPHQRHWAMALSAPTTFKNVAPGQKISATLQVTPNLDSDGLMPPDGAPVLDVEAYDRGTGQLIGGFRKLYRPPVAVHQPGDPIYAESEISVDPYPARANEPVDVCVEVRNPTPQWQRVWVTFSVAPFGIGLPFDIMAPAQVVSLPPQSMRRPCVGWVPRYGGQFGVQVEIKNPELKTPPVRSWRVLDVEEILLPGRTADPFVFRVRNPTQRMVSITLGLVSHQPEWKVGLSPAVLANLKPGETRPVTLVVGLPATVTLPSDGAPVVDVEAYIDGELIGGFRKLYRPPAPLHHPADPIYAEREIKVHPYPPQVREPTEICVEVRNPTSVTQVLEVDFRWARFGIGFPYHLIRTRPITVEAHSIALPCTVWIPPYTGRFGFEVELRYPSQNEGFVSRRVIDVGEILLPNRPTSFEFEVANPFSFPITVTLGVVKHLPQWGVGFRPQTFRLPAGATRLVTMFINPVQQAGDPTPQEGEPVLDVEAFWESVDGRQDGHGLLGGFRKLFFPPLPVHRPEDPPFAEREIMIWPYPPRPGERTQLKMEVRNPTTQTQQMTVTFQVGPFGLGLPFADIPGGVVTVTLPPHRRDVVGVLWTLPQQSEERRFCIRVKVEAPFFDAPFVSMRNVDVVRLPRPYGKPEVFHFTVGGAFTSTRPLTVELGLKAFRPEWQVEVWPPQVVFETTADVTATAVLTLTPPPDRRQLPNDGAPIADVSGYANGQLIGGIRKVWRSPAPLGNMDEPSYAESEIRITPYPPRAGRPVTFTTEVRNNTNETYTVTVEFGWAQFGFGIPFSNTNVVPTMTEVVLGAHMTDSVSAIWTPDEGGSYCLQIILTDDQTDQRQTSRRNVDVREVQAGQTFTYPFRLCNPLPITATVDLGLVTAGLPASWEVMLSPTSTVLGPYACFFGVMTVTIPAQLSALGASALEQGHEAVTINIEGYTDDGKLVGGIEVHLTSVAAPLAVSVEAVYPPPAASNVPLDVSLAITFNQAIVTDSLTYAVAPVLTSASTTWDVSRTVATIGHAGFSAGQRYTFTLQSADGESGGTLALPYTWSFTTTGVLQPPGVPVLTSPSNGAVVTTPAVTLTWQAGAGGSPLGYHVRLDGAVITASGTTSATLLAYGVHTWTVRAYNAAGASDWAADWTVTVERSTPQHYVYLPLVLRQSQ